MKKQSKQKQLLENNNIDDLSTLIYRIIKDDEILVKSLNENDVNIDDMVTLIYHNLINDEILVKSSNEYGIDISKLTEITLKNELCKSNINENKL